MVGHRKQTPRPHTVAASSPVTGESAAASASSPSPASAEPPQSIPTFEIRCAIGPAKWRSTNIIPAT